MKTEKFLRIRIILYVTMYGILVVLFVPLDLLRSGLENLFMRIACKTEPRLRNVTEKQFKSRIVRGYAANFLGMYENDLRKRWK